jgi:flagellar hook assembly protein FlgD
VTLLSRVVFAMLVAATVAAFFVTQRLKRAPNVVLRVKLSPREFSPNGDGVQDRTTIAFRLKRDDDVSVSIVGRGQDAVRELADSVSVRARAKFTIAWDGREDDGGVAPDGIYRVRLGLRRQGRSVPLPGTMELDTRLARPRVTSVAGRPTRSARVPLIVTAGRATPVSVRFGPSTSRPSTLVVARTDSARSVEVARVRAAATRHTVTWDGTVRGAPAPAGTYRLRVLTQDPAGNAALSAVRAPGIGVTVRSLAVQVPVVPARPGTRATFLVDSRDRPYRWAIRRPGSTRALARGRATGVVLRVRVPRRVAGALLLDVRVGSVTKSFPWGALPRRSAPVLVVLPALRWLGEDPTDADGDGTPNTLSRGEPAPLARPLAGLPAGFADEEGRLLAHLTRGARRYDVTTDAALALGSGPKLAGHAGVLLAGRETWLPPRLAAGLRGYVTRGGRVASFSVRTLRRSVALRDGVLSRPGRERSRDALRARVGPVVHPGRAMDLIVFREGAGLFDTVTGVFGGWRSWEPVRSVAPGRLEAVAGPDPDTPVILASSLGSGLVIRAGLPGWASRLGRDDSVTSLTDRAWELLSR